MAERRTADIAVVGAGPAGIAAAAVAAEQERRVLLLDEAPMPGGQIWRHRQGLEHGLPRPARDWLGRLERSGAQHLGSCTVVDASVAERGGVRLVAERGGEAVGVEAGALVIATGAQERFIPFPGWTLPGVVGAGGAQALLKSGLDVRNRRVVIAGSGPLLLPVAAALAGAGARVEAIVEQASARRVAGFGIGLWRSPGRLIRAAAYRGAARARYLTGACVVRAEGRERVERVTIAGIAQGRAPAPFADERTIDCDLLCVGYGLLPSTELARLLGCEVRGGAVVVDARQRTTIAGVRCAGEPTGIAGVEAAVIEGEIAGLDAAGARIPAALLARREGERAFARRLDAAFALGPELRALAGADTIVCRCEDVRLGEIRETASAREAKLHTRAGMGACQGRVCRAALTFLRGREDGDAVRPPILPASVATLAASDLFEPEDGVP